MRIIILLTLLSVALGAPADSVPCDDGCYECDLENPNGCHVCGSCEMKLYLTRVP